MNDIRKDLMIFSMLAGVIGTLTKTVLTAPPFYLHLTKDTGLAVAGQIILHTRHLPSGLEYFFLALVSHLGFGALFAIGLSFLFLKLGTDFYLIKGAFYGLVVWFSLRSVFVSLAVPGPLQALDFWTALVSLTGHLIYGLVAAWLIIKYGKFLNYQVVQNTFKRR